MAYKAWKCILLVNKYYHTFLDVNQWPITQKIYLEIQPDPPGKPQKSSQIQLDILSSHLYMHFLFVQNLHTEFILNIDSCISSVLITHFCMHLKFAIHLHFYFILIMHAYVYLIFVIHFYMYFKLIIIVCVFYI